MTKQGLIEFVLQKIHDIKTYPESAEDTLDVLETELNKEKLIRG